MQALGLWVEDGQALQILSDMALQDHASHIHILRLQACVLFTSSRLTGADDRAVGNLRGAQLLGAVPGGGVRIFKFVPWGSCECAW